MIFLRFIYQFPGNPETGKKVDVQLARGGLRLNVGVQTLHIPDQRSKQDTTIFHSFFQNA